MVKRFKPAALKHFSFSLTAMPFFGKESLDGA